MTAEVTEDELVCFRCKKPQIIVDVCPLCLGEHCHQCHEEHNCVVTVAKPIPPAHHRAELAAAEHRGYLRGRSEQRAADVAALRAYPHSGFVRTSAASYLESLPDAGGEGPGTP